MKNIIITGEIDGEKIWRHASAGEKCETCGGYGYLSIPGRVFAGEPHMADIDETRCPDCNSKDDGEPGPDYHEEK